uniref:Immunoglobulin-like beta-sandwich domain-containing protein n=1 Tax=Gopherus evgoodei TaxID=1825980 RepID=A0A8C4W2X8_9SAUR
PWAVQVVALRNLWDLGEVPLLIYPKSSISLRPSGGVALGGAVTVQCRGRHQNARFLLCKDGNPIALRDVELAGDVAEFPICNMSQGDAGSYKRISAPGTPGSVHGCSRPGRTGLGGFLGLALTACLLCADPGLPRPSISLSLTGVTAPGADVTIRCQGQRRDVRFFLHKAGDLNPQQHMDPAGAGAEFHIPTVGRQQEGNYSCSYRPRSEPFVSSQPSDPLLISLSKWPSDSSFPPTAAPLDFTNTNIARLGLCAGVLLVLGLILAEAYYSRPRGTP